MGTKAAFCTGVGLFAAHRVGPFQAEAALTMPLFRKPWMRVPMQAATFFGAYYCASQFVTRFFPKLERKYYRTESGKSGVSQNTYQCNHDLVSKFRMFDNMASADAKGSVEDYLDEY